MHCLNRSFIHPFLIIAVMLLSRFIRSNATQHALRPSVASQLHDNCTVNHFDYLVIGGGSGGIASARRAAQWGMKVGLIERQALGGTCVNVGCVPKKVMFNAAHVNEMIHSAEQFGFSGVTNGLKFDWKVLKDRRDAYVTRLNGIYKNNMVGNGVEVIEGTAAFHAPKTLRVGDELYSANHILIATGGRTKMPRIPGIEHCIDSDGFFALEEQPKKVAVVGAGYIAVEVAGVFHTLESETNLFVRGDYALRRFDSMIAKTLDSEMAKQGLKVIKRATPSAVRKEKDGSLTVILENGDEHKGYDTVVMAIGREPFTDPLNLHATGLETNVDGYLPVDEYQNTGVNGVYALGDVCGNIELTPTAIAAGRRLSDRIFGGIEGSKADYELVPTVIFSHPPIGTIGLSEEEARLTYGDDNIRVYKSMFTNLFYGPWQGVQPEDKPKTGMKLVCLGEEEKVVGLHTIGMGSDELLQGFGVAMKMGATKKDFDSCVAIHPTAAEEMVTMAPWGIKHQPAPELRVTK